MRLETEEHTFAMSTSVLALSCNFLCAIFTFRSLQPTTTVTRNIFTFQQTTLYQSHLENFSFSVAVVLWLGLGVGLEGYGSLTRAIPEKQAGHNKAQ